MRYTLYTRYLTDMGIGILCHIFVGSFFVPTTTIIKLAQLDDRKLKVLGGLTSIERRGPSQHPYWRGGGLSGRLSQPAEYIVCPRK